MREITCELSAAMAARVVEAMLPPQEQPAALKELRGRDLFVEVGASLLIVNAHQATLSGPEDDVLYQLGLIDAVVQPVGADTFIAHTATRED